MAAQIRAVAFSFLLFFLFSGLSGAQTIWMGRSEDLTIFWSGHNIRVLSKDAKDPVFDLYASLEAEEHRDTEHTSNETDWAIDWRVHVLTSVSGILCLREESAKQIGDAEPERRSQFKAYSLDRSKAAKPESVKLTELFPEQAVYKALLGDKRIQETMAASQHPNDLAAVLNGESGATIKDHDCQFAINPDFLESFALWDYANGETTVHLGLPNVGSDCMGETLEIEIKLDTPQNLRPALEAASLQQNGFLAAGLDRINPGNNPTLISFSHKHREKKKKH